ncbi:zinc-finger-containing protein [Bradyrhizobium oligotrophicum S58]
MKCPLCQQDAIQSETRFGTRHDHCGLWSWGGAPLVDRETHEARKAAHAAFDPLWQRGRMSRSVAYRRLADLMGMSPRDCHIKLMNAETARRVPGAVARLSV